MLRSSNLVELEMALYIKRVRIALVLIGVLYAWTAYGNYNHLTPWRDGSMFESEPTGEIKRLIDLAYCIIVFTGIASVANLVLAAIAGKKTTFAIYISMGIFAIYTALRVYQTNGRYLSTWLWWTTAIVLGIGFQAAYQQRKSQQLVKARLVV
jgi:hypothetical protein